MVAEDQRDRKKWCIGGAFVAIDEPANSVRIPGSQVENILQPLDPPFLNPGKSVIFRDHLRDRGVWIASQIPMSLAAVIKAPIWYPDFVGVGRPQIARRVAPRILGASCSKPRTLGHRHSGKSGHFAEDLPTDRMRRSQVRIVLNMAREFEEARPVRRRSPRRTRSSCSISYSWRMPISHPGSTEEPQFGQSTPFTTSA